MSLTPDLAPLVVPYCARCDLPCERIVFDKEVTNWRWGIQGQCCGVTMGARLTPQEVMRLNQTGEKFYLIPKPKRNQEIRAMPRLGLVK